MELLHNIDFWLFDFINNDLSNTFFDWILPPFRNRDTWLPLYILLIIYLVFKFRLRSILIIVLAIAAVGAADGISSHVLKPFVERLRPCNVPELVNQFVLRVNHCSGGFSFPSSHTANHFALAAFIGLVLYKKNKWFWHLGIIWAAIISFAQVYVGVHFPLDVIFGGLLGLLLGYIIYKIYLQVDRRF